MFYKRENTEATRLEPVVTLEVSHKVVQEENINEDDRVYAEDGRAYFIGTVKKGDPEDRESDNKSVSSGDVSDDDDDEFIEHYTRAGRTVRPVPIYNPSEGKDYVNIAAA